MNSQFSHSGNSPHLSRSSSQPSPTYLTLLIFLLSASVVIGTLYALSLLDLQVVLYLRSFHSSLVEKIGCIGNRLGDGLTLVLISVGLLAAGYACKHQNLKLAGFQTLLAHAIAGLVTQAIKHLVGRPRPRMMHQDPFQFGPSFQVGLDAFPSGHASATFAVATVLAKYFPQARLLWYGAAVFVALCRVARGSHFPTDVLAGALLGYLVGVVLIHPLKDWRSSILTALINGLPWIVASFSLVWIMVHRQESTYLQVGMLWSGVLVVWLGMGIRAFPLMTKRRSRFDGWIGRPQATLMIGVGLALSTESLLIVVLAVLSTMVWSIMNKKNNPISRPSDFPSHVNHKIKNPWDMAQEAMVALTLLFLLILIQHVKGLIPLA